MDRGGLAVGAGNDPGDLDLFHVTRCSGARFLGVQGKGQRLWLLGAKASMKFLRDSWM